MSVTPNSIVTPQSPLSRTAVLTASEVGFQAPTNVVDLLLATDNVNGARITRLHAIPRSSITTANNIQLYERNGSTYTLIDSALMATVSPSGSVACPKTDFGYADANPLFVRAGYGLAVAMGQAVTFGVVVKAEGALY
jgi:hypothetical protein